jgi:hypothetical protein
MTKELLEKEKDEFEGFNNKILGEYKQKLKEIQAEKEKVTEL